MDTNTNWNLLTLHRAQEILSHLDRSRDILRSRKAGTPECSHRIACQFFHQAILIHDDLCGFFIKPVDQLTELCGAHLFRERRGTAHIDEQHGHRHFGSPWEFARSDLAQITVTGIQHRTLFAKQHPDNGTANSLKWGITEFTTRVTGK